MRDPVVIEFAPEAKAAAARQKPVDMQKGYLIALGDAVIAVKQPNARAKLKQSLHPTAFGAASGTLWGMLLIRTMLTAKVAEDLKGIGGKLLRTSIAHTKATAPRAALTAAAAKPPRVRSAA